jgi:hypothetical protein
VEMLVCLFFLLAKFRQKAEFKKLKNRKRTDFGAFQSPESEKTKG